MQKMCRKSCQFYSPPPKTTTTTTTTSTNKFKKKIRIVPLWKPSCFAYQNIVYRKLLFFCKLQWYGHVSSSSRLAKTILQGTVKEGRRQGRQRERWDDNIREWSGLEFSKSQRAVENVGNWLRNHLWCPKGPRGYGIDER